MSLSALVDLVSAGVVALAIIAAAATVLATRRRGLALAVLLDLLTAAGVLHLAAGPDYRRAVPVAVVLGIRLLLSWSLAARSRPGAPDHDGTGDHGGGGGSGIRAAVASGLRRLVRPVYVPERGQQPR